MKPYLLPLVLGITLASCRQADKQATSPPPSATTPESEILATNFPLLPVIEKRLWRELIDAEKILNNPHADETRIGEATNRIATITSQLRERYPFEATDDHITLGQISFDRKNRTISIPARIHYPDASDTRHPGELELILCSEKGRTHETLLVTTAQPLHLELILHLAGFEKAPQMSLFHATISIPDHPPIPVEDLIRPLDKDELPRQMTWEFSGSEFNNFYEPDQTGDFLILWHAHPSVLRIRHDDIAQGNIKLLAKQHPALPQGTTVTLLLTPLKK